MKKFTYPWFALVTLVLATSVPSRSADAKPAPVDSQQIEADKKAKQLYKDGDMHYAAGR